MYLFLPSKIIYDLRKFIKMNVHIFIRISFVVHTKKSNESALVAKTSNYSIASIQQFIIQIFFTFSVIRILFLKLKIIMVGEINIYLRAK